MPVVGIIVDIYQGTGEKKLIENVSASAPAHMCVPQVSVGEINPIVDGTTVYLLT